MTKSVFTKVLAVVVLSALALTNVPFTSLSTAQAATLCPIRMKVDFKEVANEGSGDGQPIAYLNNKAESRTSGEWFDLTHNGTYVIDASVPVGNDVHSDGLMIERRAGSV